MEPSHCETKSEENRLREHICQLKTIRSTIQGTVLDLEPFHSRISSELKESTSKCSEEQLETAVLKQELMASREEMADLKAKIYVSEREKSGKKTFNQN